MGAGHSREELNKLPRGLLAYTQSTGAYSIFTATLCSSVYETERKVFVTVESTIRPSQLENQVAASLTHLPRRSDTGGFNLNYDRESPLNPKIDVGGPDQAQRYVSSYSLTHGNVPAVSQDGNTYHKMGAHTTTVPSTLVVDASQQGCAFDRLAAWL